MSKKSLSASLQQLNEGHAAANGGNKLELLLNTLNAPANTPVHDFYIEGNSTSTEVVLCENVAQWQNNDSFWIRDDRSACLVLRLGELQTSVKPTLLKLNAEFLGTEEAMGGECPKSIGGIPTLWRIRDRVTNAVFTPYCDVSAFSGVKPPVKGTTKATVAAARKKRVASSRFICAACKRPYSRRTGLNRHHKNGATARSTRDGVFFPACKDGRLTGSNSAYRERTR